MPASVVSSQTDFSAGEIDPTAKRDNKSAVTKAGARTMRNVRILNTKGITNRSGRRALFAADTRVEEILMSPGVTYYLVFANLAFKVFDATGTQVFTEVRTWTSATAQNAVWAVYDKSIYVTFTGMTPRIYTWDGAVTWTAADFAEQVLGSQKRTLFYRIAAKGITLTPGGLTGSITLLFSANVLVAGMIGTRIRYNGAQITITGVTDGQHGQGTVNEPLTSGSQHIAFASVSGSFAIGQVVTEYAAGTPTATGATGVITGVGGGAGNSPIDVTQTSPVSFSSGNFISVGSFGASPSGNSTVVTFNPPAASVVWDQEVMNSFQGWPLSVFVDQNRLGFCNFPSVPSGIAWSTLGNFADFYPDAFAADGLSTDSIFELVPDKRQVLYVIAGMDASEFIFCDRGLLYIPINAANPLKPGSVAFSTISEDEVGKMQPRRAGEFIVYASGGLNQIMVVRIFGAYTRAYKTESISDFAAHLFNGVKAVAIMTASGSFAERYIYVVNGDGTVVSGKYTIGPNNELEGIVGWTLWDGRSVNWVAAKGFDIIFTTSYTPNGIAAVQLVEILDDTRYLDASQLYNTQPSGLPIPGGGKGPLWYLAGGSVDLMDGPLGTRMMGTYIIDANGFLVPQFNAGEDFTSVNLRVGQAWSATLEPFIPPVQDGQDARQRMWKRRILRAQIYVTQSSGFIVQRLYSEQSGPNLPADGTVMKTRRFPTWNVDEDPTQPPKLRTRSELDRPLGLYHDPRWRAVKDTPGPWTVEEIGFEVTV